ncbi:MAG: radical SAM protein [Verrucomicrobia bacterium]|nr:radical SAM protein [Verrucomicrobiota bacterium]
MELDKHNPAVKDHSRDYPSFLYVYPVISRRSRGLSIGVNLNPDKRCNFNCVYCEVDRTIPGKRVDIDTERIRTELETLIQRVRGGDLVNESRFSGSKAWVNEIKDIAFSGDAEPTTIRNFSECVKTVAAVREKYELHSTKIVLITNATCLDKEDVRLGLEILDKNNGEIWAKLDAGTEEYYRLVNRSKVDFTRILGNLLDAARTRPIIIQTLLLKLHGNPMPDPELQAYCRRLNEITSQDGKIKEVQAYTIARPTPEAYATKLSEAELEAYAQIIREKTSLRVSTFA